MTPSPKAVLRDVALCVVFFTRLPMPALDFGDRRLADAIWAAPVAGLLVGLIGGVVYVCADAVGLSTGPSAALALAAMMAVTGSLHEDGLCDAADGFGGGGTRERKLEIMRDSRIGSFGAAALALSILLRWTALQDLATPLLVMTGLVAAHCGSRAVLAAFMRLLPAARAQGLSASAGRVAWPTVGLSLAMGLLALMPLGFYPTLATLVAISVVFVLFRMLCLRQIGGQTGDTVGALQQIAESTILLTASAFV